VVEEEATPAVVVEEEAAPAVVVEEEVAPTVVVQEEAAPAVVVEEEAAPTVVVEEEAAPTVVVEEEAAPTVVIEENAAEEIPVEDDYEARLEELNRTLEGLAGGPIAEAADEPVAKAAEKAEEAKELVDVEELFAEEEAAAPTRQTAESTAEPATLKKGQTGQLRYRDIFNDDDVDDRRGGRKGGRLKIFLLDLLILILAILVVCSAILVFFEGSPVANTLQKGIDTIIAKVTGEEPEAAEAATEEPALSMVQKAINDSLNRNSNGNLKEIAEDTALTFKEGITYDVRGIGDSTTFNDSQWYTNASGQAVNYSDEIVGTVVSYYSSLLDRINSGSDTVLSLIDPDSQLYGTVSAISGDGVVKRGIDVLQFGSIRENTKEGNRDYYALIRVAETEEGKDGAEVSTKVVHLKAGDKAMMIEEIADVINM
ncbi:MAG: hypothetical protein IJM69_07320, partial [Firmicutes bacterium]|nr:hypothetical protein [Bacillota bacterium]